MIGLSHSKDRLDEFRSVHVVIGNEAFDIDSTISACVYAYFLHKVYNSFTSSLILSPIFVRRFVKHQIFYIFQ